MSHVVHSFIGHLGNMNSSWGNQEHCARAAVYSLKSREIRSFNNVPPQAPTFTIDSSTSSRDTAEWFAEYALQHPSFADLNLGRFELVPVPSKSRRSMDDPAGPAGLIAEAIARRMGPNISVTDCLYFAKHMESSRSGGTRCPDALAEGMGFDGMLGVLHPAVIVDDVVTTGGHILAARQVLADHGVPLAPFSIVCARALTVSEKLPFSHKRASLDRGTHASLVWV